MKSYRNYARTSIATADPRAVVVLLYEGAVNFLNQALVSLESDKRVAMSENINRALRIIHHLSNALDFDRGEDIAMNLSRLYSYIRDALLDANIRCDRLRIEEARGLVEMLLDAWRKVAVDPAAAAALQKLREEREGPAAQAPDADSVSTSAPESDQQKETPDNDAPPALSKSPDIVYQELARKTLRPYAMAAEARLSPPLTTSTGVRELA